MRMLIVEDELPAAKRLKQMLVKYRPQADILGPLESISATVEWWQSNLPPDLVFLDIQLADGLSFDIFKEADIQTPAIFTTAYDQYTLKAFKINSIDYLLKPIEPEELSEALDKFDRLARRGNAISPQALQQLLASFTQPEYKKRFIVKAGQQLTYIEVADIQYFYSEEGLLFAQMEGRKRHAIDYTLDQLETLLPPASFFRINRKVITHIRAIRKVAPHFNSRLKLQLAPAPDFEVIVSRDRTSGFKQWLDK